MVLNCSSPSRLEEEGCEDESCDVEEIDIGVTSSISAACSGTVSSWTTGAGGGRGL